ncbi:ARM repeat-containing protein [Mycena olivaceomarginata]|nr:ARM repeat-containing protein [Mycena olivaceomarginata]
MNLVLENSISSPTDNNPPADERKQSPPAFLDLADSAARLGSNLPDMSPRLEHERQRLLQRKELLSLPYDANAPLANGGMGHLAVSAPTTSPRVNTHFDAETLSKAVGTAVSDKRKSVTYAPSVNFSPDLNTGSAAHNSSFSRAVGAKSMPASRRTSASEHDEELPGHLQGLSMAGERNSPGPIPVTASILTRGRYADDEGARYASTYNAGMMLDEQLDQEMHNAMRNLPTSDDDKYNSFAGGKITTSSAALDLAHISQTSPRAFFATCTLETRDKSSEWPQFVGSTRPDGVALRTDPCQPRDAFAAAYLASRFAPSLLESLNTTRSVPAMPLGLSTSAVHILKSPGTPHTPETQGLNGRLASVGESAVNAGNLQASLSRLLSGQYDGGSLRRPAPLFCRVYKKEGHPMRRSSSTAAKWDSVYGLDGNGYNSYGFEAGGRGGANAGTGSTALYHHNSRYGLGLPARTNSGRRLHGPKHKRGDMDREFNRFAGTCLEDLQGEIPVLCKDQHGCRYLQKKLEEGSAEHRDMIFRETFGHFADLMTDPFNNYLCQKLLEYSTDEQRNVICDCVAQDLVNISLNMHGTRAVQEMIDFCRRANSCFQAGARYKAQIHSIIVALSLHVVVLTKDLNGNHLAPEDNQFIYNAVAANYIEVATHCHGCCVLQRCINHASDHQRIQLVNEITFNVLTLVQDPYDNYVIQCILNWHDNRFSDAVIRQLAGNVCALSVQKFSSNVIEKCVHVAEHSTRKMLIEELLNRTRLEKLLRDSHEDLLRSDYAEPNQRALLVEDIRPVLPLIWNTPYGKRIQNKLQRNQMDHFRLLPLSEPKAWSPQARHMASGLHTNGLMDIYGGQCGLYAQSSFGQSHMAPQHHGFGQSIDGYMLQGSHFEPHRPHTSTGSSRS